MILKYLAPASAAAFLATTTLSSAQQQRPSAAGSESLLGGTFSLTAGADYTTGKYGGTSATDILYLPVTGKYQTDKWVFQLTVPYILVTGPGNVVRGIGIIKGRKAGPNRTEEGLGDIVAGVTRNLVDIGSTGTLIDLTGKVKFGTADAAKGLGTGENDYAGQVDVTQRVTSALSVFGSLGYDFIGSPAGAQLNNVLYAEGGAVLKISDGTRAGAIFDASQAPSPVSGAQSMVTAYLSQQLSQSWKVQVYGVKGFTNGSPDYGGGAMATFKF
jgi:hypothetical protein